MVYFSIMALYCCFLLSCDNSEKRDIWRYFLLLRIQTAICPMFHGVQARNQIFLGEFQLSDKVGCILAYPGSYPHTTSQCPSILVQYLPPHRSHWEKSIRLSLHGLFAPGLSAYPSYCHSNLVAKTRIANITNVMLHKQSNIFMMKTPSSKSAMFSVWMAAKTLQVLTVDKIQ